MNTGVGLLVMAAIFVFGVVLFTIVAITLLPASTWLLDRVEELRGRRSATEPEA